MNQINNKRTGFTIIELTIAMSFVSALLIAVTMTVIQMNNSFNRGLTLKETNQAGRSLINELQRGINSSASFDIDPIASLYINDPNIGGRLCTGEYSYIWNYGKVIENNGVVNYSKRNKYYPVSLSSEIRFVKVPDQSKYYCFNSSSPPNPPSYYDVKISDKPVELLNVSEHNLAIHKFVIKSDVNNLYDDKTKQRLYNFEILIGTNDQKALDLTDIDKATCQAPNSPNSNLSYCSVIQFDFVARAGNIK